MIESKLPSCCGVCDHRIVDKQNGDRCDLLQYSIMDNMFTYDAEMNKIMNFRHHPCPLENRNGDIDAAIDDIESIVASYKLHDGSDLSIERILQMIADDRNCSVDDVIDKILRKRHRKQNLKKVIEELITMYKTNIENDYVLNPMSYTLYHLWKKWDAKEKSWGDKNAVDD